MPTTQGRTGARERVAVALSGGVDSAVVAALMKAQGADVVALTMRLQEQDSGDEAAHVAQVLGIEHHILDFSDLFHDTVMMPFAQSYASGQTPVPCALCNRFIKFGALMRVAKDLGASALATGHYARRVLDERGLPVLHKAVDPAKDQSYFLFALDQAQIDFLRFPLGEMGKDETRRLAADYALPVAAKKDSQDICFVPCGDYASIVRKLHPQAGQGGAIVDEAGHVLGQHNGIIHFTVGQRKGLNLSARTGDHNEPLFVLELKPDERQVVVGPRAALAQAVVDVRDLNWLGDAVMEESLASADGLLVQVRLRSAQRPVSARFFRSSPETGVLHLQEPAFGVAKGQAAVIYLDTRLLGGGWIG